jgi:hypothetical protein
MIRISLAYIFDVSAKLEPLDKLPDTDTPWSALWLDFFLARSTLETLYTNSLFGPFMRSSVGLADQLNNLIKAELDNKNSNRTIDRSTISNVREAYRRFKIVLQADLSILHSYFVTQKGGFDTISLLAFGENLFPPDLGMKVPEAIFDCREAGKCLAYELPTACGFHVFRATESVLRKYYLQVSGSKVPPKVRNIGVYLNAMNQAGIGDEKIKFALKQMAELYRNPLIHPEAVLTQEEAIGVFGLARSAIAGMLAALPVLPPTTSTLTAQNISGPQPVVP